MLISTLLLVALFTTSCEAARILALLPYNARSHFIVMEPLLLELHKRGHHLTVVSSFPQKKPLQNFTDIDLSSDLPSAVSSYSLSSIKEQMPNVFQTVIFITEIHLARCETVLANTRVQTLLNEKFDLVIGEIFGADCFNYFAYKLKAPLISWVTSTALPWMAERTGLPDNPSYIPNYFMDYSTEMSIFERMYNTITLVYAKYIYYFWSELHSHTLVERVFRETLPTMEEVNHLTSLVLVNSHYTLSKSRPFTPNVIEVGGIHIKEVQPLPKDLQDLLDSAKDGVILFSFGSLVRVSSLPPEVIRMFLDVFATLPQKVIFKYEEDLPDAPPNVIVSAWLPQADVIAHPNVRLIITHCGLASTIEATHFAKPIVAIPFFSDQFQNAKNVVRRGGGVLLDIDNLSQKDISDAIKTILSDPSYYENMKRLSYRFRDRPMTPLQTAVYWTEYVIRHQGAPHLRPASVNMPLHQYLLLDVIAVPTTAILAVLLILYFVIYLTFSAMFGSAKRNVSKQKVKKSKKVN
ncbi:UDP-glucuronosyltransferase 1-1 [Homalodisca vitripennis]|nr:UDP-glucuronosyltransferase 1-1 [Homalodisca vitripennis]